MAECSTGHFLNCRHLPILRDSLKGVGAIRQYWVAPVGPFHIIDGAAFNTFTTFQSISPAPPIVLPGNTLEPGSTIELEAVGEFSNTATPTLSLGFFYGTAAVVLAQSAAITTTTSAVGWPWRIHYRGRVRSIGTAGSIVGMGWVDLGTSLTAMTTQFMPTTLALRTVAIDTTTAKEIGVGAAWGASSASNTIKVLRHDVELCT
jgi:hypothetical protein